MFDSIAQIFGRLAGSAQSAAQRHADIRKRAEAEAAQEAAEWIMRFAQGLARAGFRAEPNGDGGYTIYMGEQIIAGPTPAAATPAERAMKARETLRRFLRPTDRPPLDDRNLFFAAMKATHPDGSGAFRSGQFFNEVIEAGKVLGFTTGGKKEA